MSKVIFVGAGSGDPELITVKGHHLVKDAEVLLYTGSLVNPELVAISNAPVKENSWGMKLEDQIAFIARYIREGKDVIRLHTGDPSLYGAITEQIIEIEKLGIDYEVVPGVSSLFGAAASLRAELTPKGVSESVIITRPAGKTLNTDHIREYSRQGETMAVFLGAAHFEDVTNNVEYPPGTPAAVVFRATWKDEKIIRGTVADIARKAREAGIEKTALLIIGGAVDPEHKGLVRSHLYS
jgi:precorrin-4/cobalt-precorrin-4 C11-methyltransferase